MITQNEINFINEACGQKVSDMVAEIVKNANKIAEYEAKPKAAAEENKSKTTKTKKGE